MQIPYIKPFESVSEVLDLVGNSKEFQARMKTMFDLEAMINARLDRFKEVGEIEQIKQNAAGLLADAKGVKTEADNYAKSTHEKADEEAVGILAAAKNKMDESTARETTLAEREKQVALRETAVDNKEKQIKERETQAENELSRAAQLARQAQALQDKFTAKLGRIQAEAAE